MNCTRTGAPTAFDIIAAASALSYWVLWPKQPLERRTGHGLRLGHSEHLRKKRAELVGSWAEHMTNAPFEPTSATAHVGPIDPCP